MSSTTTTMTMQSDQKYKQGKHYVELTNSLKPAPPVIVFFSFLDSTSPDWASKDDVAVAIRRHVPAGTIVDRYHVSLNQHDDFAQDLTAAWAVAKALQIDDRIIAPLSEAVQDRKTVFDMEGVKSTFDQAGIPPLRFDREYSKTAVQKEANWMHEVQRKLGITQVPAIVVAGRYLLKIDSLGPAVDADKVADVVKELLALGSA